MKAICVSPNRELEVRDISKPMEAAPGHVLIDMNSSAINHGDISFLKMPGAAGNTVVSDRREAVWGASGAGWVAAVGAGVPARYAGKPVAVYRSLGRTPESLGLWSERAQVPFSSCLILPGEVDARDYSGSLVNVMTAYAFLEEIGDAGHKGVIVTAGNSATGLALASLAKRKGMPAIFLVRSASASEQLKKLGVEHVVVCEEGFTQRLSALAMELETTAVFEGVGGNLVAQIIPSLPMNSMIYFYGFLGGAAAVPLQTALLMAKNLTLKRFSNFESNTVKDRQRLMAALNALEQMIQDPMFRTKVGKTFTFDQIEAAMAYQSQRGEKAVLVTG